MCVVTGSTIIDFLNNKHSVTDRCVYNLMTPKTNPTFNLLAAFGERRREDVIFLDHLILRLKAKDVKIYLEQGGRVLVSRHLKTNVYGDLMEQKKEYEHILLCLSALL